MEQVVKIECKCKKKKKKKSLMYDKYRAFRVTECLGCGYRKVEEK